MELEFKKGPGGSFGYYIDGLIQWATGRDYFKYPRMFHKVYQRMFPDNKAPEEWNNILVIGGGDFQLISECTFLSYDNRITIVDPGITDYFTKFKPHSTSAANQYKKQYAAMTGKAFLNIVEKDIQTFLAEHNEQSDTYDLIVCDLIDDLALDPTNIYSTQVYEKLLRPGGIMIGYGGLSTKSFFEEFPLLTMDITELHVIAEKFQSWNSDTGVFYGLAKAGLSEQ